MSYIKDMALMGMRNTTTSPSGSAVNADWAENNPNSASYVKNRTHYAGRNVTFDGVLEGKEYIYMEEEGFYVVKVSDTPITEEELEGLLITAVIYGNTRVFELSNDDYELMQGGIILSNYLQSTPIDIEYQGIPFTRGLYFMYSAEDIYIKAITIGVKTLDAVYLPSSYIEGLIEHDFENYEESLWHNTINPIYNRLSNLEEYGIPKIVKINAQSFAPGECGIDNNISLDWYYTLQQLEQGKITKAILDNKVILDLAGYDGTNIYFTGISNNEYYNVIIPDGNFLGTWTKTKLAFATE